ncbi:MAG TPA: hypothetical protein VGI90_07505 [Steroidobacteraceae bacterium]|jgi:hypothetical protein
MEFMIKPQMHRSLTFMALVSVAIAATSWADQQAAVATGPAAAAPPAADAQQAADSQRAADSPLLITQLLDASSGHPISGKDAGNQDIESRVGLHGQLCVVLSRAPPLTADQYVLFLNGTEIKGLAPPTDGSLQSGCNQMPHALVFKLRRGAGNDDFFKDLLKAPTSRHAPVMVSLGQRAAQGAAQTQVTIVSAAPGASSFQFEVFSAARLTAGSLAVLLVLGLVWGHARTRTTLRDSYLPQLPPRLQTYSLARWQMAFWFTLIFAAFVFLYALLSDTNTISAQALALMGISGTTALAAVGVDAYKDSPADAVNRGLRALGLNSYADVQRLKQEILDRQNELSGAAPLTAPRRAQLQTEIQDRMNILRTYEDKVRPFVTQGWFRDMTTDLNGIAIHRLQVFCWTLLLGAVFVIEVYRELSMPEFSGNLLALMAISSAGYVGFKFPEVNS